MPIVIPPPRMRHIDEAVRQIVAALRGLADGRSNAVGDVVLSVGASTTTVDDPRVGAASAILLSPLSASSVSADTHVFVAAITDGQFTLGHDVNAAPDRRFRYAIQG